LEAIYNARCLGLEPLLPELSIQYADYALWERDRLQGAYLDRLTAYWTKQLDGSSEAPRLPLDLKRPAIPSPNGGRYYFKMSSAPLEEFQALFRREGATCYSSLLSAFSVLLMFYTGGEDVLLSSPAACRELPELEPLIGCFANTLLLRMDLSGAPSFREVLKRAGRTVWAGVGHQRLPFHSMIGAAGPRRQGTQALPIQVNFRVAKADVLSLTRLTTEFLPIHNHGAKFDLAAEFTPDLEGFLDYSTDVFRPETMPMIASHFENLLGLLVRNPDIPITSTEFRAACSRIKTPPTLRNFRRPAGVMAG
jgi:non-ribosomal peptide synthetase component F